MTDSPPVSPEGPAPLPCPFCGSTDVRIFSLEGAATSWTNVQCHECYASRDGADAAEALARWNRRPARSAGSPETQERIAGMLVRIDRHVPPDELHVVRDGRVVFRLQHTTGAEVVVGSSVSRSSPGEAGAPPFNELEHFALRLDAIAEYLNTSALDMAIADLRKLAHKPAALSGDREDSIPVTINGLTVRVPRFVSYADVVRLAGYAPERVLSVVYHQPSGRSGTLSPKSDNVEAMAGTRFSVADTSNA